MAELLTAVTPEQRRKLYPLAVAGIGIMALTGCSQTNTEFLSELSPEKRASYDYGYLARPIEGISDSRFYSSDCLVTSGFINRNGTATGSYDREADILTITAQSGDTLELTGFTQYEHTVEPANETSQAIFDAYGCEVESYTAE